MINLEMFLKLKNKMNYIINFLNNFHPIVQALIATCFTWFITALGAATVFLSKKPNIKILDTMLGFAGGVMIAASFWSLLAPAIEMSAGKEIPKWIPALSGFIFGGIFLRLTDKLLPHLHIRHKDMKKAEGIKSNWKKTTLLIVAITLHNVPEGLAIGVAFGALASGLPSITIVGAVTLAIGIGIQNFPEGLAVSMPLRREGLSQKKSFMYGQLSGVVEPIAGVIGASIVAIAQPILPYALGFAAGAMIFVVVEDVIPEAQSNGNVDLATMGAMVGFAVMMTLDVAFS